MTTPSAWASGAPVSSQIEPPYCQTKAFAGHGREVVALTGLIGDAVEIVFGDTVAKRLAFCPLEVLADVTPGIPVGVLPVFIGAGKRFAEGFLESCGRFAFVAEEIFAIEGDVGVGELAESRNSWCRVLATRPLLRAAPASCADRWSRPTPERVQILHDRRQFRIILHILGQIHVVTALDERAEPLTVGDDHLIFLLTGGERGGDALVKARPGNEVHVEGGVVTIR